ncbi:amidohydrolase family protein [Hyphomicrobium sp. DY-1]|uniref:amidohydrolase family protein n=1 Tax=Hyphomicrobium sp. DY-1 TaxID=3075650 RepID=UPI0039C1B454
MTAILETTVLKGAHVIDPANGIDRITDIMIHDGRIAAVGDALDAENASIIDLKGKYVTPGWIDMHVHAYGTLGFADPDTVGVYHGVTSFVEAGGPGIGTLDEFFALMTDLETDLYVGPFIRPLGLLGLNFIEGDVRTLGDVPITRWVDTAKQHKDRIRYIKCNAMGDYGPGTLNVTKGLAQILGVPLYMHIGEFQLQTPDPVLAYEAFRIAEKGDMITHIYHGNLGQIIDENGKIMPVVKDALERGVIFDLGFGGYNFSWDVAEKAFAQGIVPHTISSDLQQFNVVRPAKSLANVLSIMMHLGMPLKQIIEAVTINSAKAISLTDRAGDLSVGKPADVTVFEIEEGQFELSDCFTQTRTANKRFVPKMTFKNGKRFDVDMDLGQNEANWFLQIAEDHIPEAGAALSDRQRAFLGSLGGALSNVDWELSSAERLDIPKALELQALFHRVREENDLPLREALRAVYDSFVDSKFTMQIGLFLMRIERPLALSRMAEMAGKRPHMAA